MTYPVTRSQGSPLFLLFGFHLEELSPLARPIGFRHVNWVRCLGPAQSLFHQSDQDPQQKHRRADTQH